MGLEASRGVCDSSLLSRAAGLMLAAMYAQKVHSVHRNECRIEYIALHYTPLRTIIKNKASKFSWVLDEQKTQPMFPKETIVHLESKALPSSSIRFRQAA